MPGFSDTAIILRIVEVGDHDLMVTLLTRAHGKLSAMAKNGRQSVRRFGGALSLFTRMDALIRPGRGQGVFFLMEADPVVPFDSIRTRYLETAYASFFCELVNAAMEPETAQPLMFTALETALGQLDLGAMPPDMTAIVFLMAFLRVCGIMPDFSRCGGCKKTGAALEAGRVVVDLAGGTLMCDTCRTRETRKVVGISMGAVKELLWLEKGDAARNGRLRLSPRTVRESLNFLELFTLFHLGREIRSHGVLKSLRAPAA